MFIPPLVYNDLSTLVEVIHKDAGESIITHKTLAAKHSKVLRELLDIQPAENGMARIILQDTSMTALYLLLQWISKEDLPRNERLQLEFRALSHYQTQRQQLHPDLHAQHQKDFDLPKTMEFNENIKDLIELWYLADYLLIKPLQNAALVSISHQMNIYRSIPWDTITDDILWEREHGLAKIFIDVWAWRIQTEGTKNIKSSLINFPEKVVEAVMARVREIESTRVPISQPNAEDRDYQVSEE